MDVERFSTVDFKPRQRQSPNDHQLMNAALDPRVARFKELQQEKLDEAELWGGKLTAFCSLYGFLSQIKLVFRNLLEALFVERLDQNEEIFARFMNDKAFQKVVTGWLSSESCQKLRTSVRR